MTERDDIPGLADLVDGPDAATHRRLAAGVATLAASAPPARAPDRRRRWTRPTAVALLAAVVAAIVLVPLLRTSPARPPAPTATTSGPTGATSPPLTTSTVPSQVPQGASAPIPAGSIVPIADLTAVSFWNDSDGAALVGGPRAAGPVQLGMTRDGGRTWTAGGLLPDGGGDASSLAFTSPSSGFSWNADVILATSNGGRTWNWLPAPSVSVAGATVTSVSVAGGDLRAGFDCNANCRGKQAPFGSVWSWTARGGWHEILTGTQLGGEYVQEVVRTGAVDLVLAAARDAYAAKAGAPTGELFVSTDGGTTWSSRSLPCGDVVGRQGNPPQMAFEVTPVPDSAAVPPAVPDVAAALACTGQEMMEVEPESVWALSSLGAGGTWQLRADDLPDAGFLYPHLPPVVGKAQWGRGSSVVQAPTPGVLWMDGGQAGPSRSTDGGRTWQQVTTGGPDPFFPEVQFVDARHGWCLRLEAGGLYETSDGGVTWHRLG